MKFNRSALRIITVWILLSALLLAFAGCFSSPAATTASETLPSATDPAGTDPAGTDTATTAAETTAAETTAAETTAAPVHVHTPSDEYTVDARPTCTAPGSESKHCTECDESLVETAREIPIDPEAHALSGWTVIEEATLLNPTGMKTATCSLCGTELKEAIVYAPKVEKWDSYSSGAYQDKAMLGDLLGDRHFFPIDEDPEGNDLLVEYSILWNESCFNLDPAKQAFIDVRFTGDNGSKSKNCIYWAPTAGVKWSDSPVAGSFEYGGCDQNEPDNPYPRFTPNNPEGIGTAYTDFPNIGGPDPDNIEWGWHRVSVRLHEEVTNEAALMADSVAGETPAEYKLTVWVYIDGELVVHAYANDLRADSGEDRKLYSAESDGLGGINYTENVTLWVYGFRLNSKTAKAGTNVYFSYADLSVTVGKDFVQDVEKVAEPVATELEVEEGVSIPTTMYYQAKD